MKNTKKKLKGQSKVVKYSFTGSNITKYLGLNTVAKYMNKQDIIKSVSTLFPTRWHSAAKFGVHPVKFASRNKLFNRVNQVLISIIMASFCGINRTCKISLFTGDTLTDDFWANDILWQLGVFAYNLPASWRVRQKKNRFKRQEHWTFIENNQEWTSNGIEII
ncbi:MAG: hypothetical protein JJE17_07925 [Peptostreptococcaceae bacterium]|nr:hypothetical protein [Peptostreptococcaceae bacterium]